MKNTKKVINFKIDENFWAFIRPEPNCRDIPHNTETMSSNSRFCSVKSLCTYQYMTQGSTALWYLFITLYMDLKKMLLRSLCLLIPVIMAFLTYLLT